MVDFKGARAVGEAKKRGDRDLRVLEAVSGGRIKRRLVTIPGHFEGGIEEKDVPELGVLPAKTLLWRLMDRLS